MHLHLITRYPCGVVGKVLVYHLNVTGSIPTPAMIFLLGFYQSSSFSLERDREREREREKIDLMNESFPLPNIKRLKFENKVKSIETSLSKNKNKFYLSIFSRNPHWLCWYKASRQLEG
jgi:hypothetical protein